MKTLHIAVGTMSDDLLADLSMNTDNTAYLVTTIALLGGILAFYYYYVYDPHNEVCIWY